MPISELNPPLKVSTDGTAGPYVIVTPEQLGHVVVAFREAGIDFRVDQDAVLPGGTPLLAVIDLVGADVDRVQRVLDRVATDLLKKGRHRRRSPTREELVVRGPLRAMQELTHRLDADDVKGWTRQREIEARFRNSLPPRTSSFCFSKRIPALGRQVVILLRDRGPVNPQELFVSGVVPLEGRDALSLKDHDEVIDDVRSTLIDSVVRELPVRVLVYRVHVGPTLEDSLSPAALARLRAYSETANMGLPDQQRWADFIKQTHIEDAIVDPGMLVAWLTEEGFPGDQRDALVREYESGRRLLRSYNEERE